MKLPHFLVLLVAILSSVDAGNLNPCQPMDVAIILDWTQSIGHQNLENIIAFCKIVIERLYISPKDTRVVLARFGKEAYDISGLTFSQWGSGRQIKLLRFIDEIPTRGLNNETRIDYAVQLIEKTFAPNQKKSRRKNSSVKNVAIVFTDGVTDQDTGELHKPSDVDHMFVVAVPGNYGQNDKNLRIIAGGDFITWNSRTQLLDIITCGTVLLPPRVVRVGCFKENPDEPVMKTLEGTDAWLLNNTYSGKTDRFNRCAWSAWNQGYRIFGLQDGGHCFSGYVDETFFKYGLADNCLEQKGGVNATDVYYFRGYRPPISYGKIGCFRDDAPVLPSLNSDPVLEGKKFRDVVERCAWAARVRGHSVFAVTGKGLSCSSSAVIDRNISNYYPVHDAKCRAHRGIGFRGFNQLYFVGRGRLCAGKNMKRTFDIAIVADVSVVNLPLFKTLVDTIDLTKNRIGLIRRDNSQVLVKFKDPESGSHIALLPKIESDAVKPEVGNGTADFTSSLIAARDELFSDVNGDRYDIENRLLLFTDVEHSGGATTTQTVLDDLKDKGVRIFTFRVGREMDDNVKVELERIASRDKWSIAMKADDTDIYRKGLEDTLKNLCKP